MSELAVPAALRGAKYKLSNGWGVFLTVTLIVSALSGLVLGLDTASVLVLGVGLLAAVCGLRSPRIGLIGIGTLATVDTVVRLTALQGQTPLPFNSVNYWLALFCLVNIPRVFQLRQLQSKLHLLLIAVLAGGLLWTPALYPDGLQEILRLIGGFTMILYFAAIPPSQHRILFWAAVSASVVASIFGFLIFHDVETAIRFNRNELAMMPLTGLFTVFLATFATVVKGRETHILMFLGAANLAFVFLCASRGAILTGLFLWLGMLVWGVDLPRKVAYGAAGFVILMGVAALSPKFQEYAVKRLEFTFDSSRSIALRSSGRTELARVGWRLFLKHPTGVGTGGFATSMGRFYSADVRFWGYDRAAHSAWVKVLAENGVLGILVFSGYVISFAWTGFQRRRYGLLPIGFIAASSLALRFTSTEYSELGVWWFAAGSIFLLYPGMGAKSPVRLPYALRLSTPSEYLTDAEDLLAPRHREIRTGRIPPPLERGSR